MIRAQLYPEHVSRMHKESSNWKKRVSGEMVGKDEEERRVCKSL